MTGPTPERRSGDGLIVIAVAIASAGAAVLASAEPTGSAATDAVLIAVAVGVVVWLAAAAPRWMPATAAGIAALVAFDPVVAAIGLVACLVGVGEGFRLRQPGAVRVPALDAAVAGVALNALLRSELGGFHGLGAIIGIGVGVVLAVGGLLGSSGSVRRVGVVGSLVVGAFAVLALVGVGAVGVQARPDLSQGAREAREAITQLNDGNYDGAADLFESASEAFARSDDRLGGPLARPSRLVPGVAQNVRAGAELSAAAAIGSSEAAAALRAIDPSSLTVVDGAIDLDAVAAVEDPLLRVQAVLDDLQATSNRVASPWLVAPVQEELVDLDERLASNEPALDNALDAVRLAPQLLGADGERRYLVFFATPVEARGLAGFVGNYAVVTADQGRIDVGNVGRRSDLEAVVARQGASCATCPDEVLARYGRFGFVGGDANNGFAPRAWSSVTLPAHYPYVGETAQILFPQSGGDPIDGVITMDPFVIQALMQYTGAIEVPDLGITVEPDGAADFILRDQYLITSRGADGNAERIDALDTIGNEVVARLLTSELPEPSRLARDIGPLAAEQRLLIWTDDPAEQALLERVGLLGALPALGDDGGFSVVVTNLGHSKIDLYLDREVDVEIDTAADGTRTLLAEVTLTNNSPDSGQPRFLIGNDYGLDDGTSWLGVNFFGPPGLRSASRDGEPVDLEESSEAGWQVYATEQILAPGTSVSFRLEFELGPAVDGVDQPVRWSQPLATRAPLDAD